eukprot:TRINITY_DN33197_c0_g2_i3.p1 TRINITY_DN33197_c0_g2~~TRINITY_DN33197_c0_g2_i3.p1  ORF type:complete len:128 (+),score=11.91 TRINITY_DN33197_c0_g2_i3:378-761(+)
MIILSPVLCTDKPILLFWDSIVMKSEIRILELFNDVDLSQIMVELGKNFTQQISELRREFIPLPNLKTKTLPKSTVNTRCIDVLFGGEKSVLSNLTTNRGKNGHFDQFQEFQEYVNVKLIHRIRSSS